MIRNPLERHRARRVAAAGEKVMAEGGWGTHLTYETRTRAGRRMYFQMRMPDGAEFVEVSRVADVASDTPAFVGRTLSTMEQAGEQAGVFVVGAVRGTAAPEAERGCSPP